MHPLIDLAANVGRALWFAPPFYVRSVLGEPPTWLTRFTPETELRLAYPTHFPENVATGVRITVPAWPGRPAWVPARLPAASWLFRESSTGLYPRSSDAQYGPLNESWMLLNGICTDDDIFELNAQCVYELFGRQLTLLHNETHGAAIDLFECALGKGWATSTEAVRKLFPALYAELKRPDIDRVVLIAHSQGTILAAVFLALLRRLMPGVTVATDSMEARHAAQLLSRHPGDCRARVLKPQRGPQGASFVKLPLSNGRLLTDDRELQTLFDDVAYWLDWTANDVLGLPALREQELRKLEIYCFATCATDMRYILKGPSPAPYMEHFGNERDLVARLGLFSPSQGLGSTRIDGARFVRRGGWGHLLNAHYLSDLREQWEGGDHVYEALDGDTPSSRLEQSFRGARAGRAAQRVQPDVSRAP